MAYTTPEATGASQWIVAKLVHANQKTPIGARILAIIASGNRPSGKMPSGAFFSLSFVWSLDPYMEVGKVIRTPIASPRKANPLEPWSQ
jgi:hypothetical protein